MLVRLPVRWRPLVASLAVCAVIGGCSNTGLRDRSPEWRQGGTLAADPLLRQSGPTEALGNQAPATPNDNSFYLPGNSNFINPQQIADARVQTDGDIKLNFQNANLLEVIKVILGDMLGVTYVVDPSVQGAVSMQTANALSRDDLIPTLEMLLRMNNAAILADGSIYRVVPQAQALTGVRAPQLGDTELPLPPGYSVRVLPLKHVSAEEMAQILEPFIGGGNQLVRVDTQRNLLVLAASGGDMDRLIETVRVFDVDRMRGMSVAMFTPDFVDAKTLGDELDKLLANPESGLMPGLVRFMVIDRLNGLMVVTPRAEYLARVRDWVGRLDRDSGNAGQRLFIYRVQNGKATELAETLSKLFEPDQQATPAAEVAPGLTPVTVGQVAAPATSAGNNPPPPPPAAANAAGEGLALDTRSNVRVIADEANNALLILAGSSEYRQILSALKQLDISPMQVLVEVTIAEVSLIDDLQYGVEWFFNNRVGSGITGVGTLDLGSAASGTPGSIFPGFSYAFQSSGGTVVNAVLNMLASESNLSIVSSPSLLVLNNQEATIQVGDEVPITTQQQQASVDNSNIINSIEYRDTGVLLKVKPRINAGGLVIMEVEQEASIVPATSGDDPLTPRIQTRKITSTVAVNSGDTIILGGLIEDNHNLSESGVPILHTVPVLGNLFGSTSDNIQRTELLVMITPRAITHRTSALQVTEEFRRRMHSLVPVSEPPAEAEPAAEDSNSSAPDGRSSSTEAPNPVELSGNSCERIGPFADPQAAAQLAASLPGIRSQVENNTRTSALGYRVLVNGDDDEQSARAIFEQLQGEGFADALLYTAGPSANHISLGLYAQRENAARVIERVGELGLQAEMVDVDREQTEYWLDLQFSGAEQLAAVDSQFTRSSISTPLQRMPQSCEQLAGL